MRVYLDGSLDASPSCFAKVASIFRPPRRGMRVLGRSSMLFSLRRRVAVGAAAAVAGGATLLAAARAEPSVSAELQGEADVEVCNWSMTHSATAKQYFQPESPEEVQRLLETMHAAGQRVRVVGSALSPNGIGLSDQAMLNMAQCDRVPEAPS